MSLLQGLQLRLKGLDRPVQRVQLVLLLADGPEARAWSEKVSMSIDK